jgi:hypothetical protein
MVGPVRAQTNKCEERKRVERIWWQWHSTGQRGPEPAIMCTSMTVEQKLPYDRPCQDCYERFFQR